MIKYILIIIRNFIFPSGDRRLQSLRIVTKYLLPEYRLNWPQMDWWRNENFNKYLDKFDERDGLNSHRRWMLSQLLRLTISVPGATAECGVYKGAGSWLICDFKRKNNISSKHYLFDSFAGLSTPNKMDGAYWKSGDLSVDELAVLSNLNEFLDMIELKKGWIPHRFEEVENECFSFVHVDVDLADPTRHSIEYFYERLSHGAVFLCDDYGFNTCPGVTVVIDEFLSEKPEKMISLDAGGGFFIKGIECSDMVHRP